MNFKIQDFKKTTKPVQAGLVLIVVSSLIWTLMFFTDYLAQPFKPATQPAIF